MKGYKCFLPDFTCNPGGNNKVQYSENATFSVTGEPRLCYHGIHFCPRPNDVFNYYPFNPDNIVCEVEAIGVIDGPHGDGDKACTSEIRVGRRLSWFEVLALVNSGRRCTGLNNSGNLNSGNLNSGSRNSGNRNSGGRNSGNLNSGDWNSGDWNSGDWNSGDWNSGNLNSGDWNSGNLNSGDWNSGDWNSGKNASGVFCSERNPKLLFFDLPSEMTLGAWQGHEAYYLRSDVVLTEWRSWSEMTADEKEQYPRAETAEGYLKMYDYKDAHRTWWSGLTDRQRKLFVDLPNFTADKFKAITGIDIQTVQ